MFSAVLFFLIFAFLLSTPASADYRFCNATSYVLQGAIGTEEDDNVWRSRGWVRIAPGACAAMLPGPVAAGNYHVFARSIDAHQGATKYFSGSERFCTVPKDFIITGRENCALRGYESSDFIRVATRAGPDWTTTFGEPRDYSLEQAQVAGAQRLLRDNGLRLPKIDGYAAKNTRRAVMAFQRAAGREATGEIDADLIAALIAGAEREQAKFGLNLCNKTPYLVWAAVGFPTGEEDMSSGWIRIEPGQCAKAIKGKLLDRDYFVYAEATDAKGAVVKQDGRLLVWSGAESFCVKTTRFEIKGRDACTARGYDERRFMRVDTGGKALFDVPLE
jgi:uncharacterized membrane protein